MEICKEVLNSNVEFEEDQINFQIFSNFSKLATILLKTNVFDIHGDMTELVLQNLNKVENFSL